MKKIRKYIAYAIPVIAILLFIAVMESGSVLKKPFSPNDNVEFYIQELRENLTAEDWAKAKESKNKLDTAWHKVLPRIQFSVERMAITEINESLSRIDAYIKSEEEDEALAELFAINLHWRNMFE